MFFGWKIVWLSLLGSAVFRFERFGRRATVPMSNSEVLKARFLSLWGGTHATHRLMCHGRAWSDRQRTKKTPTHGRGPNACQLSHFKAPLREEKREAFACVDYAPNLGIGFTSDSSQLRATMTPRTALCVPLHEGRCVWSRLPTHRARLRTLV